MLFREKLDDKICISKINGEFYLQNKDQRWTNRIWDIIEKIIKDAMKEVIPIKEICKSEISKRPKLRSNTFKVNKWLLRIIKTTKKDKLYELGFDKKKMFIERLYKLKEKYETLEFNVEEIKDNLYYNKNEELIENLKDLNKKVKVK